MKKILSLLAFAAVLFVSCNKQQKPQSEEEDLFDTSYSVARLDAPANLDYHFSMVVDPALPQEGMKNPSGEPDRVTEITLPPGLTGIVVFEKAGPKEINFTVVESKVGVGILFQTTGAFQSLLVTGVGGDSISVTASVDGVDVPLTGKVQIDPEPSPYRQDVCRNWIIEETILAVTGDNIPAELSVAKKFNNCNISEMVGFAIEKGVNIEPVGTEYDVRVLMIDPCGKFGIFFEGKDPYYGDFTLKGDTFSYHFTQFDADDNPYMAGTVTGQLRIVNNYGRLEINAVVNDSSGKYYSVSATFKMSPQKKES